MYVREQKELFSLHFSQIFSLDAKDIINHLGDPVELLR